MWYANVPDESNHDLEITFEMSYWPSFGAWNSKTRAPSQIVKYPCEFLSRELFKEPS